MGKSSKGASLAMHLRNEIIAEIIARGEALSMKKGTYASFVFEWWFAQGCPAVTPSDQAMQDLKLLRVAEEERPKTRRQA